MIQKSIKTVRPIREEEIQNAPWVSIKTAMRLTGLGEKDLRTLTIKRFGKADFCFVKAINKFILSEEETEQIAA